MDDSIAVEQFKALGDPVRWAIVRELRTGSRCACELSDIAEVSPPLLSHHLKVLREAGLIVGTKRGRWIDDALNGDALCGLFTRHAVAELELDAAIDKITDPAEIASWGVMTTPALVINDQVVAAGRVPNEQALTALLISA